MDPSPPRKVVIITHPQAQEAEELLPEIIQFLDDRSVEVLARTMAEEASADKLVEASTDMVIALGGDGTMLRAGSLGAASGTPVLGINLGRLGFLVEVGRGWMAAGPWSVSWRATTGLRRGCVCTPNCIEAGDWWGAGMPSMNASSGEAMWRARSVSRPKSTIVLLARYVADALICATATGSTAYALAAGGPILPPELRNLVLVPVAPHLSLDRAIVLPEGSKVRIGLDADHEASFGVDGQNSIPIRGGDEVRIRAAEQDVHFVRLQDQGYFFRNLTSHMDHFPQ